MKAISLLPFSIDYDGPAEIERFFKCRVNPAEDVFAKEASTAVQPDVWVDPSTSNQSLDARFRGRQVTSTPVALPEKYIGHIAVVDETGGISAKEAADRRRRERIREIKRARLDSDADDDDDDTPARPTLRTLSTFDHIHVWGADRPINPATDAYVRGIHEWSLISDAIHGGD